MARRTIYLDDVTEWTIEAAFGQQKNFSRFVDDCIRERINSLSVTAKRRVFREVAERLGERMTTKGGA